MKRARGDNESHGGAKPKPKQTKNIKVDQK